MPQGYRRKVTNRERKYLAEIGARGGKSRSHKKLMAVNHNLIMAMQARFPNDPKWKFGKNVKARTPNSKTYKTSKTSKTSKPVRSIKPQPIGKRKFAHKFTSNSASQKRKVVRKMSEVPKDINEKYIGKSCFICLAEIGPNTPIRMKRNPSTHRPAPVHLDCVSVPASGKSSENSESE